MNSVLTVLIALKLTSLLSQSYSEKIHNLLSYISTGIVEMNAALECQGPGGTNRPWCPYLAPWGSPCLPRPPHQSWASAPAPERCSGAGLQLLTALPCLAMGPAELGPCPVPREMPRAGAAPVPCSYLGWWDMGQALVDL